MPNAPTRDVAVDGGHVTVHDLAPGADPVAPLVLLVHGITANAYSWTEVAGALRARHGDDLRLWAPDLRGRADSAGTVAPAGLGAHVDDLLAIADELAPGEKITLVGHSMGAFVAALAAGRHPERFSGVVLVDGGFAFPAPDDLDIDAALQAVIGPAMQRLSMTFDLPEDYLEFWAPHPAVGPLLQGSGGDAVREYLLHDLVEAADGTYRSSCVADVIRADGADVLADAETHAGGRRAADAGVPLQFLWAERGLMNEETGLYTSERLAALDLPEQVHVTAVDDVDHYEIVFGPRPVAAVCDAVDAVL